MYGHKCPECGAILDPGEKCDCRDEAEKRRQDNADKMRELQRLLMTDEGGQMKLAV